MANNSRLAKRLVFLSTVAVPGVRNLAVEVKLLA